MGPSGGLGALEDRRARRDVASRQEGRATAEAADRAAAWIASLQSEDGGWARDTTVSEEPEGAVSPDVGATSLALLGILSTGATHLTGDHRECVKSGLRLLRHAQSSEGAFDAASFPAHLAAALAMVEAYGVTTSVIMKGAAQRGADFIYARQRDDGSWADAVDAVAGERDATASAVTVLAVAHLCELDVDRAVFPKALAWLGDAVPDARTLLARVLATAIVDPDAIRNDVTLRAASERVLADLAADDHEGRLLGALAAFQLGGETWRRWEAEVDRLDGSPQRQGGVLGGSWDPSGGGNDGDGGARLRETALRCNTLGVRYRWPRIVPAR